MKITPVLLNRVFILLLFLFLCSDRAWATRPLISAGGDHSLALKTDGTVWAWGYNSEGQLGDGTRNNKFTPVQVGSLNDVIAVSGGALYSLALKSDGTAWAWGDNGYGQLGVDTMTVVSTTPVQVSSLNNVIAISAGAIHSLALKNDGTVWAWGHNGSYGLLGDGTTTSSYIPVQVSSLNDVIAIAAGDLHSLALKNDGTAWAWGHNGYGQLGVGTMTVVSRTPVQVSSLNDVFAISGGCHHSMALKKDGTAWAWGLNDYGQLGIGTTANSYIPAQISSLSGVSAITGGHRHSLALKNDDTVWAWGINQWGQLGDGTTTNSSIPIQISSLSGVSAIAQGWDHSLALRTDGTVWAWGYNPVGQLGDGTMTNRYTPIQTLGPDGEGYLNLGAFSAPLKNIYLSFLPLLLNNEPLKLIIDNEKVSVYEYKGSITKDNPQKFPYFDVTYAFFFDMFDYFLINSGFPSTWWFTLAQSLFDHFTNPLIAIPLITSETCEFISEDWIEICKSGNVSAQLFIDFPSKEFNDDQMSRMETLHLVIEAHSDNGYYGDIELLNKDQLGLLKKECSYIVTPKYSWNIENYDWKDLACCSDIDILFRLTSKIISGYTYDDRKIMIEFKDNCQ